MNKRLFYPALCLGLALLSFYQERPEVERKEVKAVRSSGCHDSTANVPGDAVVLSYCHWTVHKF